MIPLPATRAVLSGRQTYAQKVLTIAPANLLAYWPLNEASGTQITDLSGSSRHGVYTGVDLAQSQPPFICPLWDGVNDVGNVYSAGLAGAFNKDEGSAVLWYKVNSSGVLSDATARRLLSLRADASNVVALHRTTTNNQFTCTYSAGGTAKSVNITNTSVAWQHVAITWSKAADQMIVYLNGTQTGATQTGLGVWAGALASTGCNIGALLSTPTQPWHGYLAHAALWSTPLSAPQILALATP